MKDTFSLYSKRKLSKNLSSRHIQLMTIGSVIGTGLFIGSANIINLTGPSIILIYIIVGSVLFFVMRAMSELLLSKTIYRSLNDFFLDLLGPWSNFFISWTYIFCWIITGVSDLFIMKNLLNFWFPTISLLISSILLVSIFFLLNFTTVKIFGEIEFWFAIIKIIFVIILIFSGIVLSLMHYEKPNAQFVTIKNVWQYGGIFPNGITGFLSGFQISIFSFIGIEIIGIASPEAKNLKESLPKSINLIPTVLITLYVFYLFFIMTIIPWSEIKTNCNPFIKIFSLIHFPYVTDFFNFLILISTASSTNSGIFSISRILNNLSKTGKISYPLYKLSNQFVTINSLLLSCLTLLLVTLIFSFFSKTSSIFNIFATISAILFIFICSNILFSYLIYLKRYPDLHEISKFKMPFGKFSCYLCLIFFILIFILFFSQKRNQIAIFIIFFWFILLIALWNLKSKYRKYFK